MQGPPHVFPTDAAVAYFQGIGDGDIELVEIHHVLSVDAHAGSAHTQHIGINQQLALLVCLNCWLPIVIFAWTIWRVILVVVCDDIKTREYRRQQCDPT